MPSPFVGMDPYLENPAVFPDLHDSFSFLMKEALNVALPAPYYAGIRSRVWVETSQRFIGPDVDVLRPQPTGNGGQLTSGSGDGGGGVAVAEEVLTEPVVIGPLTVQVTDDEIRENFVEIYAQPGGERLVTTIELLSLANKTPGDHGRDLYLRKQREVLQHSQVHLVEIDLLRGGTHSTAVPRQAVVAKVGAFDYHVCIHHYDRRGVFFVYPVRLGTRLPVIVVPLLPGAVPVRLDLQGVLDRCYDSGQYGRRVRYRDSQPAPPLSPEQAQWAERLLREKGLLETLAAT